MPRDYSSRRDNSANNNGKRGTRKRSGTRSSAGKTRRRSAPSANTRRRSSNTGKRRRPPTFTPGSPGCLWLVCGIFLAIVILSIYYISRPVSESDTAEVDLSAIKQNDADHASADKDEDGNRKDKEKQRFSFYKSLPNYKVKVDREEDETTSTADRRAAREAETATDLPAPGKVAQSRHDTDDKPTDKSPNQQKASSTNKSDKHSGDQSKADDGKRFLIQAGAFSSKDDANKRKARLEALDTPASIREIETDDGRTVYRVHSDPISPRDKAQSLADKLESNDIENFVQEAS